MTNEEAIELLVQLRCCVGSKKYKEMYDLAISALERDRWISVEERLPEKPGLYIVYLLAQVGEYRKELSYATEMYFNADEKLWVDDTESYNALLPPSDDRYCVTHWKKMPEPPKEET